MISYFQAIVLGLLQGVSELFPISSLGHSVILPSLLHWHIHQNDPFFLDFLVATHLATAIVLFCFYYKDWIKIISGIFRSIKEREIKQNDTYAKLGWLLILGTIPVGAIGLVFEEPVRSLFASATVASIALIVNGFILFAAEMFRRKAKNREKEGGDDTKIAALSYPKALGVGIMQIIALIPGFSRTGATLTGSLLSGLSHEDALRFSFLLATPSIGAAALLKIPDLFSSEKSLLGVAIVGAVCAGCAAFFAVKFLVKYFKTKTLIPFAVYCIVAGVISFLLLLH